MISSWRREIHTARRKGWSGLRATADMSWALRPASDLDRLAWYEAQVNRVFADETVLLERLIDDAVTATRAPVVDVSGVRFADVSTAHLIVNAALSSTAGQLRLVPSGPTW